MPKILCQKYNGDLIGLANRCDIGKPENELAHEVLSAYIWYKIRKSPLTQFRDSVSGSCT